MRLTRRKLRKLLLRETRLLQEGGTSELCIEIGEMIEEMLDQTGGGMIPFRQAIMGIYSQSPKLQQIFPKTNYEGYPEDLAEFVHYHMGWGVPELRLYIGR